MRTSPPTFQVRRAEKVDAAALTKVINAAFAPAEMFFVEGERIKIEEVFEYLEKGRFLVAEEDKAIKGCVYLEERGNDRTYLGLLSVDPSSQGQGIGSLLMVAAEEECRSRKSRQIDILIVNLRAELQPFYGSRGYLETGRSPFPTDVPTKVPCHFINLSKELEFETA